MRESHDIMPGTLNDSLLKARRIVIKLGTQIVIDDNAVQGSEHYTSETMLAKERLARLVDGCAHLVKSGREVILVSSGAVGLGRKKLGLDGKLGPNGKPETGKPKTNQPGQPAKLSLSQKQACAAVGQNLLMDAYQQLFEQHGLITAQVLVTAMDFADRQHYLTLRQTLETLLELGVVPILNENDSVSTMEMQDEDYIKGFGDNDKLSALVGAKLEADLLVILTNVAGIYTENPAKNANAVRIPCIESLNELKQIQTAGQSALGRGGMASKLEAARLAAICGLHTYIASGYAEAPLTELLAPCEQLGGTLILPQSTISGRKRWIGMASGYHGSIIVNEGARLALLEKRASLLPVGIVAVEGEFLAGQVVSIQDERRMEIGRGLSAFASGDVLKVKGQKSDAIKTLLGSDRQEIIHRDNLVIFEEHGI